MLLLWLNSRYLLILSSLSKWAHIINHQSHPHAKNYYPQMRSRYTYIVSTHTHTHVYIYTWKLNAILPLNFNPSRRAVRAQISFSKMSVRLRTEECNTECKKGDVLKIWQPMSSTLRNKMQIWPTSHKTNKPFPRSGANRQQSYEE